MTDGPGKTLAIDRCGACPMSVEDFRDGISFCVAVAVLDRAGDGPDLWRPEVSPDGPPPDWCPLRAGPVTLEVRG